MATIYSTRFAIGAVTAAVANVYTVPAGFVAVVRCLSLVVNVTGATANVRTTAGAGQIFAFTSTVPGQWAGWDGRQVVNAGETITVTASTGSTCDYFISGYLLSL